jgi:hypothetical protein
MTNVSSLNFPQGNSLTYYPYTTQSVGVSGMKASTTITKIAPALLKAQRKIEAAVKDVANSYFKSKYADLNAVMASCKEHLNDNGIVVLQPVISEGDADYVETILLHESGEYFSSRMKLILTKADMQAYGSAVSYARRYSLQSLVFIGAEDDDGEATMGRNYKAASKPAPKVDTTTTSTTPDNSIKATEALAPGAVQAEVQPLKKSSFRKPKKTEEPAIETTEGESDDWS